MPRAWSEATKACHRHPSGVVRPDGSKRSCSCKGVGWRYRLAVPDPVTGRRGKPQWSQTFPTKDTADRHQGDVRKAIAEGRYTNDGGKTLEVHLREWLDRKQKAGRKASTVEGYRSIVETRIVPALGHHRLGRLSQHHVQAWLEEVATEPQRGKGRTGSVTSGALVNLRAALRAALNDAVRRGLVTRNVAKLVELPEVKRPDPISIDAERLRIWLNYCDAVDDPLTALWLCVAVYGPRRGELLGLRWCDIDTIDKLIRIEQELVDVAGIHACPHCKSPHNRLLFDTPKSAAGERIWPLVPEVEAAFNVHKLRQDEEREAYGCDFSDHGLVFARPDGTPWRPDWISREFKRLFKASGAAQGLTRVPPIKALRSTSVTALHEAGLSLEVIRKVSGHAGTQVMREHYLSVAAERTRSEFEAIASRLDSSRSDRLSDQHAGTDAKSTEGGEAP
jgi:integrase